MTPADCTPAPSSVKRRTPSAASSAIGAKRSPRRPTVIAPATATSALAPSARSRTVRTASAESSGGSVLGIATTAVKPPSAAARVPDSTVSASSSPGWRRWVWRSTRPGATTHPPASRTRAPRGTSRSSPTAAIRSPSTATSARRSPSRSMTLPPRMTTVLAAPRSATRCSLEGSLTEQEEQDGHPDRDAVAHLVGDVGRGQLGNVRGDLDPADHRSRVQYHGVRAEQAGTARGEAVARGVLTKRGDELTAPPLFLYPEQR